MRTSLGVLACACALALPQCALAQPSVAYLAASCTGCHGTAGRAQGTMPALAGLPEARFVERMREFRDRGRPATVMPQIVAGYSDEDLQALAAWFARQPRGDTRGETR
jgi:sulfide dehydrogenase cytochrome subunit